MQPEMLDGAKSTGFAALNVTHPCKQSILPLLTCISTDAGIIGADKTVAFVIETQDQHSLTIRSMNMQLRTVARQGAPDAALRLKSSNSC